WYLNRVVDGNEVDGFQPVKGDQVVKDLGLQGVNPQGISAMGFPTMNITGFTSLSTQPGGVIQDDHDVSFASSTTWSKSKHTLKFGGEYRKYLAFLGSSGDGTYGSFDFNGSLSGFGYSDFLLGLPFSSQRLNVFTNRGRHSSELGLYVDDTYKVNNRITLTL